MFHGHHGASGRTVAAYRAVASRVDGSSHERGRWTMRLGMSKSPSASPSSASARTSVSALSEVIRLSNWTSSDRTPGVASTTPGCGCWTNHRSRACTRHRRARSRAIGPYSTSRWRSPDRRTAIAGRSSTPARWSTTPPAGSRCRRTGRWERGPVRLCTTASCRRFNAAAVSTSIGRKRTESPGLSWPSFHRSADTTVAGHTKPPRLGPSGPSRIGMSPVKSTVPTA